MPLLVDVVLKFERAEMSSYCSYRAIKLLEQLMKVVMRVLEKKIRCQVSIDACTVVRTDAGLSESFEVKVDLHNGQSTAVFCCHGCCLQ